MADLDLEREEVKRREDLEKRMKEIIKPDGSEVSTPKEVEALMSVFIDILGSDIVLEKECAERGILIFEVKDNAKMKAQFKSHVKTTPNIPYITYKTGDSTHFLSYHCGDGDKAMFDSYVKRFQRFGSHQFCQTFALMHASGKDNHLVPAVDENGTSPKPGNYLVNAFLALQYGIQIVERHLPESKKIFALQKKEGFGIRKKVSFTIFFNTIKKMQSQDLSTWVLHGIK